MLTVELVIDSSTGTHNFELRAGDGNTYRLAPAEATTLAADLCTAVAFTLGGQLPAKQEVRKTVESRQDKLKAVADEEEHEEQEAEEEYTEDDSAPLKWTRKGTGVYEAQLDEKRRIRTIKGRNGWNVKIGNRTINDAPIVRKMDAYKLVDEQRSQLLQS